MREKGIESREVFTTWLAQERAHLLMLKHEPSEEALEIEYLKKLKLLQQYTATLKKQEQDGWMVLTPLTVNGRDYTQSKETARRHLLERADCTLHKVQALEVRIKIEKRWELEDADCLRVDEMLRLREYRQALDTLKGLVIARLFKLTKMNQSQTGEHL